MTSFLTFTVTSLRIAGDIPIQSDYLPLITLYMILSIIYTLFGFIWFTIKDYLLRKKTLPYLLRTIAEISRKLFCSIFISFLKQNKVQSNHKVIIVNEKNDNIDTNMPNTLNIDLYKQSPVEKCSNCVNLCKKCQKDAEKSKSDKEKNKNIENDVKLLNKLVFSLLFIFIFICNVSIWSCMDINYTQ